MPLGFTLGSTGGVFAGLAEVQAQALLYLPWAVALPAVAVWAFLLDGVFFGATRTAELRNGMALALLLFALAAAILVPSLGNHGLWLALLLFLGARGAILAMLYRRRPDFAVT